MSLGENTAGTTGLECEKELNHPIPLPHSAVDALPSHCSVSPPSLLPPPWCRFVGDSSSSANASASARLGGRLPWPKTKFIKGEQAKPTKDKGSTKRALSVGSSSTSDSTTTQGTAPCSGGGMGGPMCLSPIT